MRAKTAIVLLLVAATAQVNRLTAHPQVTDVVVMRGSVLDSEGAPLPDVRVRLLDTAYRLLRDVRTDDNGNYSFDEVAPGAYRLNIEKAGYILAGQEMRSETGVLNVTANQDNDFRFRLARTGAISGVISDFEGQPLSDVSIRLLKLRYDATGRGGLEAFPNFPTGETSPDGNFRIDDVAPGEWFVQATFGGQGGAASIAAAYYPGGRDIDAAVPVRVLTGQESYGIHFRFDPLSEYTVSGTILNLPRFSPAEIQAARVSLKPVFYLVPKQGRSRRTEAVRQLVNHATADDRFELRNVAPGHYDLHVGFPSSTEQYSTFDTFVHPIEIRDSDVAGIEVILNRGKDIAGNFVLDAATPGSFSDMSAFRAFFRPSDGRPPGLVPVGSRNPLTPATSRDGKFEILGVAAGQYDLFVNLPPGLYVRSARLGFQEIYGRTFAIGAEDPGSLVIELSGNGATFGGTVRDAANLPFHLAQVLLIPPPTFQGDPTAYRLTTTDAQGNFTFQGLRPGVYSAYAFSRIEANSWRSPEYLLQFRSLVATVDLWAGQQLLSDLKLIVESGVVP